MSVVQVNATYSQVNPETGEQMRAISGLTFRTETKHGELPPF